jgi:cysteine-rich repeat protein
MKDIARIVRCGLIVGLVAYAILVLAGFGYAASPKAECIKSVCKGQKSACLGGFTTQFAGAKSACGSDKACKKTAKQVFKTNKQRCTGQFKTCKTCCGGAVTTGCAVAVCGDGNVVAGEDCDDGENNSNTVPNACRASCRAASCGDGIVDSAEECDPPGIGLCDVTCAIVSSTTTTTTSETTTTTTTLPMPCGNGTLDAGEECDDGNVITTDGCTNACTTCGNGTVTSPEGCDDRNLTSGDGCDANCTSTACGNQIVTLPETCDDGNGSDEDDCPANCIVELCDPMFGSDRAVNVNVASGGAVAGLTVLLDYPEGLVRIPGSGGSIPEGIISDVAGFFASSNDLDHGLRQVVAGAFPIDDGLLFRVHFENCRDARGPVAGDFSCRVLAANDASGSALAGVTCSVTGLPSGGSTTTASTSSSTSSSSTSSSTSSTIVSSTSSSIASSTSSSSSTTTISTTTTTISPLCGNGATDPGETCDDGNRVNNDACPSDCVIDSCTPIDGSSRPVIVRFTPPAGGNIGGIAVLLDYPEGTVSIPGPPIPGGIITGLPVGAFPIPVHLRHALRETVALQGIIPPGQLFRVNFRTCAGAPPVAAREFDCTVIEATDNFSNPVSEVTCEASLP